MKKNLSKNLLTVLLLLIFFPVGLYLMWKKTNWSKAVKIIISVCFALLFFFEMLMFAGGGQNSTQGVKPVDSVSQNTADNIGIAEKTESKETAKNTFSASHTQSSEEAAVQKQSTAQTTVKNQTASKKSTTTEKRTTTKRHTTTKRYTTTKRHTTTKRYTTTTQSNREYGRTVYITPTGKRYHFDPDCGGKNSTPASLSYAVSLGLTPCQKCAS